MTRQVSDTLVWQGKSYFLEESPGLPKQHDGLIVRPPDQFPADDLELSFTQSTACYRGYTATWVVIEDKLYLDSVLGDRLLAERPLFADWVSKRLLAPTKPLGKHVNIRFTSENIEYLRLTVNKGVVTDYAIGKGKGEAHHVSKG